LSATGIKFDLREFQTKLQKCVEVSRRSPVQVINSHAYQIVKKAMDATPKASRGDIQQAMGAELVSQRVRKGKIQRRYKYSPRPIVYALVNARQKKLHRAPFFGSAMAEAAKKFISGKLKAVGSLANGWRGALRSFARAIGQSAGAAGPKVKHPGIGKPAQPGDKIEAVFEYNLLVSRTGSKQIDPRVEKALEKAFAGEEAEMKRHLEEKLSSEFSRIGV
jgi:hypothetical protein